MAGKCNQYFDNKTCLSDLQSQKNRSENCLVAEKRRRRRKVSPNYIIVGLVVSLVAIVVGCIILTSIVVSVLRQVQKRVETLERRVEYLERNREDYPLKFDDDEHQDSIFSKLHSSMKGSFQKSRNKRTLTKEARKRNKELRKKTPAPLVSIHMEMATHQRRKRSESNQHNILELKMAEDPSTENSNKVVWKVSDWVPQKSRENFKISSTELADIGVKHKGLYFIYAQVVFRNLGMNNIISIRTDDQEITRCYDGVDHVGDSSEKLKTCYTGTVALIRANENITVHNLYGHDVHSESISNFFGLIKLSDVP